MAPGHPSQPVGCGDPWCRVTGRDRALGRGCLDAPQVEGTIYRLSCEKLEAPSATKIVEMLIIIGVVG